VSNLWRSARKFIYQRLLHADDSPHRIALGVAIGVFVAFTPTMGAQTILAIGLAAILRANKAAGVPMVWITNPVTFVPIYGSCWWLGSLLTGGTAASRNDALQRLQMGGHGFFERFFTYDFWAGMLRIMFDLGTELWVGCLIVGVLSAVPAYFLTRSGVTTYRARRQERLLRSHERRQRRRKARAAKVVVTGDAV